MQGGGPEKGAVQGCSGVLPWNELPIEVKAATHVKHGIGWGAWGDCKIILDPQSEIGGKGRGGDSFNYSNCEVWFDHCIASQRTDDCGEGRADPPRLGVSVVGSASWRPNMLQG
uniref:Uncharacterized protein n=1 Tax=Eutreptiella gymnastica TaxID=73025 RepID=A0A7S4LG51_9EUGL